MTSTLGTVATKKVIENAQDDINLETTIGADKNSENLKSNLTQVLYIQYSIIFEKKSVWALFHLCNKVNAIYTTFAKHPRLPIRLINIAVQKIDSNMLDTYKMIVTAFLVTDKVN